MAGGEGGLRRLGPEEAEQTQHELARDPGACFFRVEQEVVGGEGRPPLRTGDVLIVRVAARPREGDPVVVELAGEGYRLGHSRQAGAWCVLATGAAVPLAGGGGEARLTGVVVGLLRRSRPTVAG